jgi:hypothetical protein
MNKVIEFPEKKEEINLIVPAQDFEHIIKLLVRNSYNSGVSRGCFIGFVIASVVNLFVMYLLK